MNDMASLLAACSGITEADVRDWVTHPYRDMYTVRAWNHRRYQVTGLQLVVEHQSRQ